MGYSQAEQNERINSELVATYVVSLSHLLETAYYISK